MPTSDFPDYFYSITSSNVNNYYHHARFALHTYLSRIKSTSYRDGIPEYLL